MNMLVVVLKALAERQAKNHELIANGTQSRELTRPYGIQVGHVGS